MRIILCFFAISSFAGIIPAPLQGHYQILFQGCLDRSDKERLAEMNLRKKEQNYNYMLSFYGDRIVEETSFGPFCVLSMQSRAMGRDRLSFDFSVDYSQATPVCREAFQKSINAPTYDMTMKFKDRFVTAIAPKDGDMGAAMSVIMDGSLFGCSDGVDYEYAFKKQSRFSRMNDPIQVFYRRVFRYINNADIEGLKEFVQDNVNASVEILNTEHRDPLGRTMLMYAVRSKNIQTINFLLELGASLKAVDAEGKSVGDYAKATESEEIVTLLSK